MDVFSSFDAPRFRTERQLCWKIQWLQDLSIFPSVKIIFYYEDYTERWWNRTDRKYRYTFHFIYHKSDTD